MKRNLFIRWFFGMVVIVGISGAVYYMTDTTALLQEQQENGGVALFPGHPVAVNAEKVERQNIAVTIGSLGVITASESSEIHAPVSGRVDEIGFQEGQSVKEGDILLEINSRALHLEMDKARAELELAQAAVDQDEEGAGIRREKAQAMIDTLNARMEQTQIKAPFDGVIGLRNFSIGNTVQEGQILTSIDAVDPMNIEFPAPAKNFAEIHEGKEVVFTVDSYPDLFFKGEIFAIDSRVNAQTRSFNVKAMAANTEGKLRTGMYARLQVPINIHANALVVPDYTLVTTTKNGVEKTYVFVIDGDHVRRTEVQTGIRQADLVEITAGLKQGTLVAASNIKMLRNKSAVTVQMPIETTVESQSDSATDDPEETSEEDAAESAEENAADTSDVPADITPEKTAENMPESMPESVN